MKYIKNNTLTDKTWLGQTVLAGEYFLIPANKEVDWSSDSVVIADIALGEAIIAKTNDGLTDILSINEAIDYLKNNLPKSVLVEQPKDAAGRPIFSASPFSDAGGFRFRGASFKGTIASNTTQNIDYKITQERWINGGRALIDNVGPDDQITFQVVDKDNIMGFGAGIVLDEFISDYYVPQDGNIEVRLSYPAKITAGLYLRLRYTSTHASGCTLKCNLYLHWKAL